MLNTKITTKPNYIQHWSNLAGSSSALAICETAAQYSSPILLITPNNLTTSLLQQELEFFSRDSDLTLLTFPNWETLPYDRFSPHQDIVSARLKVLSTLPNLKQGVVIASISTLMQRLPPKNYVTGNSLQLKIGQEINLSLFRNNLINNGYRLVQQVVEHGEFAIRGSICDIFPSGSKTPLRIDLFDNEVDTIRIFDPETQRSEYEIKNIDLLPARECPLTTEAIKIFAEQWATLLPNAVDNCPIFQNVSTGNSFPGIEYYLPLFFTETATLFDYLDPQTLCVRYGDLVKAANQFWHEIKERHEQLRYDRLQPILAPNTPFVPVDQLMQSLKTKNQVQIHSPCHPAIDAGSNNTEYSDDTEHLQTQEVPEISISNKLTPPLKRLQEFTSNCNKRILICAESTGRKEALNDLLQQIDLTPTAVNSWKEFESGHESCSITVGQLRQGFIYTSNESILGFMRIILHSSLNVFQSEKLKIEQLFLCFSLIRTSKSERNLIHLKPRTHPLEIYDGLALITETEIFGHETIQQRSRKDITQDPDSVIRDLVELNIGDPVVHIEHGIGKYLGLQTITSQQFEADYLAIEYANQAKLYIPIASLHLISRYLGASPENVQYNRLGSNQWQKAKRKATEKIYDVAAELLKIHAQRAAKIGFKFNRLTEQYQLFSADFPFETTNDQQRAIDSVLNDMTKELSMDRLICGDVGFGKTEVAMRAAFIAAQNSKQVAILVPTTLLAQQHYDNFQDRFAAWPINIAMLSRFNTAKEQRDIVEKIAVGTIDIVIGTHKLLQKDIKFKELGLLVVDEEHRFGVKQKEKIKSLRSNVDILTLTATPIPRTLSMSLAGIRELSIISTPPQRRLTIKTMVKERNNQLIREVILREIWRGGQVYFLHNNVATIAAMATELQQLIPEARIAIAHGQMHEKQLEHVMNDFYHLRCNLLICTTIIESGIDVPTANTIIINRADRFGLAQLHQLRGRVGRSHHQAYAYLIVPDKKCLTNDAKKRLQAFEQLEDLGMGFALATHDLEIRGAGEILGCEQSGQIQAIGYSLYMELLDKAVKSLKSGQILDLEQSFDTAPEIELAIPALLPDTYVANVNTRLTLYKRIASAATKTQLRELQIELIDRFGLLPDATKNLFSIAQLKLLATTCKIAKIKVGSTHGHIEFAEHPNIDSDKLVKLIQTCPSKYRFTGSQKFSFVIDKQKDAKQLIEQITELVKRIER